MVCFLSPSCQTLCDKILFQDKACFGFRFEYFWAFEQGWDILGHFGLGLEYFKHFGLGLKYFKQFGLGLEYFKQFGLGFEYFKHFDPGLTNLLNHVLASPNTPFAM